MTIKRRMGAATLLKQLEQQARTTAYQLEAQGRLPTGFTQHHYPPSQHEQEIANQYRAAFTLADDLTVCRALLQGERVPRHRLNPAVLNAHERRTRGR